MVGKGLHRVDKGPTCAATVFRSFATADTNDVRLLLARRPGDTAASVRFRITTRSKRFLHVRLLVRWSTLAREAAPEPPGKSRTQGPLLPLLGQRALVARLGRR